MFRAIAVSACLSLIISISGAQLLQTIPQAGMQLVLSPGSTRGEVLQQCEIAYDRGRNTVTVSYANTKIAPDSITIHPPDGLAILRTDRPSGRPNTILWEIDGGAGTRRPTEIRYTLDGLTWRLLYRMDYVPSPANAAQGTVSLSAEVELTNESGMDLRDCALSIDIGTRDDGQVLRVENRSIALPAGWTGRWALRSTDGTERVVRDLEADIAYIYDPLRFKSSVRRMLQISPPPDERALLAAMALPEGALDLYLPGDDLAHDVPTATATWHPTPGTGDAMAGPWVEIDAGPEASIVVEDTLVALSRDKFNLDKTGRVSGFDIIENRRLSFTNYSGAPVMFTAYQEVATKWELKGLTPALEQNAPADRGTAKPVWTGRLPAGVETVAEFTLIKHQGTNK